MIMTENKSSIYNRRSIRKFQDKALSKEQIEEIIQAGSAAPSAKNRQPWKCIVLGNRYKEEFLTCMEKGIAFSCDAAKIKKRFGRRKEYITHYAGGADFDCSNQYERKKPIYGA